MAKWTPEDWDRCEDAREMLKALGGQGATVNGRKLRLYAATACSRFRQHVTSAECLAALDAAHRDADKPLPVREREAIRTAASDRLCQILPPEDAEDASHSPLEVMASAACAVVLNDPLDAASKASECLADIALMQQGLTTVFTEVGANARHAELFFQANLLRHIVGNPFRPFRAPPALPAAVVQLAAALEAGDLVAFALRDALLEAGQTELAEHFGGDEPHPRGCWALDVIGGRK